MTATMTQNRFSTHGPDQVGGKHTCPYKKCGKSFRNAQGVRMHVGRVHTKVIPTASSEAVSRGLAAVRTGERGKHLTKDEATKLAGYVVQLKDAYPTKKGAFDAAVAAAGLGHKLKSSSTNVDRYWKMSATLAPVNGNGHVNGNGAAVKPKRKYTRRTKPEATIPLIPTNPSALECVVTGPGLRIEFSAAILPTILHTIAMSIGEK